MLEDLPLSAFHAGIVGRPADRAAVVDVPGGGAPGGGDGDVFDSLPGLTD